MKEDIFKDIIIWFVVICIVIAGFIALSKFFIEEYNRTQWEDRTIPKIELYIDEYINVSYYNQVFTSGLKVDGNYYKTVYYFEFDLCPWDNGRYILYIDKDFNNHKIIEWS